LLFVLFVLFVFSRASARFAQTPCVCFERAPTTRALGAEIGSALIMGRLVLYSASFVIVSRPQIAAGAAAAVWPTARRRAPPRRHP
jgi:hypothetical protein